MPTNTLPSASSHVILLENAEIMTEDYRTNREAILNDNYINQDILPLSETFARGAIDDLLALPGCEGIRIYYGMDTNSKVHAVLVAVDEENADILTGYGTMQDEALVLETGQRCPPSCPPSSVLNS
jgi:hypothetical protein